MFEELRLRHSPLRAQRFFRRSFTRIAREFSRWQFRSPVAYGAVLRREISPTAQRDDGGGRNGYAFSSSSSRVTVRPVATSVMDRHTAGVAIRPEYRHLPAPIGSPVDLDFGGAMN